MSFLCSARFTWCYELTFYLRAVKQNCCMPFLPWLLYSIFQKFGREVIPLELFRMMYRVLFPVCSRFRVSAHCIFSTPAFMSAQDTDFKGTECMVWKSAICSAAIVHALQYKHATIDALLKLCFLRSYKCAGNGFRGLDYNVTIAWQSVPKSGLLLADHRTFTGYRMPQEYTGSSRGGGRW